MKKQGRQLNILNGLFLKNTKEQEEKVLSAEIQKSQERNITSKTKGSGGITLNYPEI